MFPVFHSARFHSGFVEILFWGGALCHWVRAHFVTGLVRTLSLGSCALCHWVSAHFVTGFVRTLSLGSCALCHWVLAH